MGIFDQFVQLSEVTRSCDNMESSLSSIHAAYLKKKDIFSNKNTKF